MLTNAQVKDIASLAHAKGRRRLGAFMAEGTKCVGDTLAHFGLRQLLATPTWLREHAGKLAGADPSKIIEVSRADMQRVSQLSLVSDVLAVYELPTPPAFDAAAVATQLIVALDRVQDPGNLGTIMRVADWMGINTILASTDTADCFSPKTVQSTMGAISRVRVQYGDLASWLGQLAMEGTPVCGTFLDGENIYTAHLPSAAVIVMGNEGRGVSPEVAARCTRRLLIPPYPADAATSESLNVAVATSIVLSQFRARSYGQN